MPRRPGPIGAHVSVAGGLARALARAEAVGAEVIQIFVANPRGWAPPADDPVGDEAFRVACAERGLQVFVHAPYLINFGSPSPETLAKSSAALEFSLRRGAAIGASGVVLHAGSAVLGSPGLGSPGLGSPGLGSPGPRAGRRDEAMGQVRGHVLPLLDAARGGPPADEGVAGGGTPTLLIEPTAGGGQALASDADSLCAYLDALGRDERVGVCLDTCHMHAAGHDLSTVDGFANALRAFGQAAGRGRIGLVHVNDSRDAAGSKRDRHEAVGRGTIGPDAFAALFASAVTRNVPLVVETAEADHAADIATLKALRAGH